ncbi:MAG: PhzF family phenazine biosynthesis isomerase [Alphaproteobacteria bacterium]|nr:PhzF family phenazine biosynthesis isomerase [Alphaproteobacteria bacterium]
MTAFELAHVFCHNGAGGNPTGLVLDAGALSTDEMQALARQCGHESGFVLSTAAHGEADFRFRYFVPRHEMEMCGHATVGALWLLRERGRIADGVYRIATLSGIVTGAVGARVEITQPLGEFSNADRFRGAILDVLGIGPAALAVGAIENARTSRTKTLVPMASAETLHAMTPDFARVEQLCTALGSTGLYPYAVVSTDQGLFEARQFPRGSGYPEDAATGIAATALASALLKGGRITDPAAGITIYQGRAMGALSEIRVRFARDERTGAIAQCWVSGAVRTE